MKKEIFLENVLIALNSIKSQLIRTILTSLIIALGIMSLVGILTAIDAIKASISSEFTSMGANTFVVRQLKSLVQLLIKRQNDLKGNSNILQPFPYPLKQVLIV